MPAPILSPVPPARGATPFIIPQVAPPSLYPLPVTVPPDFHPLGSPILPLQYSSVHHEIDVGEIGGSEGASYTITPITPPASPPEQALLDAEAGDLKQEAGDFKHDDFSYGPRFTFGVHDPADDIDNGNGNNNGHVARRGVRDITPHARLSNGSARYMRAAPRPHTGRVHHVGTVPRVRHAPRVRVPRGVRAVAVPWVGRPKLVKAQVRRGPPIGRATRVAMRARTGPRARAVLRVGTGRVGRISRMRKFVAPQVLKTPRRVLNRRGVLRPMRGPRSTRVKRSK